MKTKNPNPNPNSHPKIVHPFVYWCLVVWGIPTWTVTRVTRRWLPPPHPWKNKRFTLIEWSTHETPLARFFDTLLWYATLLSMLMIWGLCSS